MKYPQDMIDLYFNLELTTLRVIIYDLLNQLNDAQEEDKRKSIIDKITLPMRVYLKYSSAPREEILQAAIDNEININLTYEGMRTKP
jgi:hypothetical protein